MFLSNNSVFFLITKIVCLFSDNLRGLHCLHLYRVQLSSAHNDGEILQLIFNSQESNLKPKTNRVERKMLKER
jgi:hypothetical protein